MERGACAAGRESGVASNESWRIVRVSKKLLKIFSVVVDLVDLAVEIKAIVDGKLETIQAHITSQQAEMLKNGLLRVSIKQ